VSSWTIQACIIIHPTVAVWMAGSITSVEYLIMNKSILIFRRITECPWLQDRVCFTILFPRMVGGLQADGGRPAKKTFLTMRMERTLSFFLTRIPVRQLRRPMGITTLLSVTSLTW